MSCEVEVWQDVAHDKYRFRGEIDMVEVDRLKLDDFDRLLLRDCFAEGRAPHDWLLAIEMIFRRLHEQSRG